MIKNRTTQIVFQTIYCTLGVLGIVASLGLFDYTYNSDFFVYFTNISNYLCVGLMFVELVQTIKKKKDDYVTTLPILKFIGLLAMLLTFVVFNFVLASTRAIELNFKVTSVLFHIILPLMYVGDWVLFYERKKIKWYYPLISIVFPLVYVIFIFMRAWILKFDVNAPSIYPYFFLNLDTLGVFGVFKWVVILALGFIGSGFILFGIDQIKCNNK